MRSGSATITMRRTAGTAIPTPMPMTKRPARYGHEVAGRGEHDEAGDVEAHAEQHEPAGVAAVGQRGDQDLGEEAGEEAHPDDGAELRSS